MKRITMNMYGARRYHHGDHGNLVVPTICEGSLYGWFWLLRGGGFRSPQETRRWTNDVIHEGFKIQCLKPPRNARFLASNMLSTNVSSVTLNSCSVAQVAGGHDIPMVGAWLNTHCTWGAPPGIAWLIPKNGLFRVQSLGNQKWLATSNALSSGNVDPEGTITLTTNNSTKTC